MQTRQKIARRAAKGHLGVDPGLHLQQPRDILHRAPHRTFGRQRCEMRVTFGICGNKTPGRAKPIDITKGRRVAQAAHHIAAIGHRQHTRRKTRSRPTGRPTRGAAQVIGVARHTKDRVEAVAAMAPFGRVGLADEDRACGPHSGCQQVIRGRHEILEKWAAPSGAQALGRTQVLYRKGQAMQPALPRRIVGCPRLCHQRLAVTQRDHRIHRAIHGLDPVQMRRHHLGRGHLARRDPARQLRGRVFPQSHLRLSKYSQGVSRVRRGGGTPPAPARQRS